MIFYFFIIRIAALFGHRKARLLVRGQREWRRSVVSKQPSAIGELKGCVWIHAASVGEFEQARPLIERLRQEQPNRKILLTFFSPSGYELRKNYDKVDAVRYLPFATRRNAKRFLTLVEPEMAIFVKYEFWPAYLRELKKRDIPTYSISAIFRPKQLFFLPWGKEHLKLLKCFTHIYVQDKASEALLKAHGVSHCSVAGDTRFDRVKRLAISDERLADERMRGLEVIEEFVEGCQHVIVAGSTWPEDERLLAQYQFRDESLEFRGTKLILVPHEIDEAHMHTIFEIFKGRLVRYSQVQRDDVPCTKDSRQNILHRADVLVIDTIGLLSSIYRYGQVAYIGGGFGVGIHNTIEAAVYGIPVLFGPNYQHFREAAGLIAAGAAQSVSSYEELETALNTALQNHETMGAKAAQYVQTEIGATDKIYQDIF